MAQLKSFVAGTFRVCKFQSFLLAEYLISVNNCSCSHLNFGQTGGDLSFGSPAATKWVCTPQLLVSTKWLHTPRVVLMWNMCYWNGPANPGPTFRFVDLYKMKLIFKKGDDHLWHHLQSASQIQLSIGAFGKTKLQKLLGPKTLCSSVFFWEHTFHVRCLCRRVSLRVADLHIVAFAWVCLCSPLGPSIAST